MRNKIQLITYANSLGKDLKELDLILEKYFKREIKGVHILPFYPSSADRGFSPLTHLEVDKSFGDWDDIKKISHKRELVADLVVNHISSESKEFQDFLKNGQRSKFKNFFITTFFFIFKYGLPNILILSLVKIVLIPILFRIFEPQTNLGLSF